MESVLPMANDPMIAGNIALKNELRDEMGSIPSTQLVSTQGSVAQYRRRTRNNSPEKKTSKCSRMSQNNLLDMCLSGDEEYTTLRKLKQSKMKKMILLKLLKMYKEEDDTDVKAIIKYAMKALKNLTKMR